MNSPTLLDKILRLEREIVELKNEVHAKTPRQKIFAKIKGTVDGVLFYWVPLALIVGLAANWWFQVGFFEDVQNIGINKKSSNYYLRIGDRLMNHAEFKEAAEAFTKSLEINPYNINATHGLMKAQVLQAIGNDTSFNPIVVEDKLNYLRGIFPKDDYILLYCEGVLRRQQSATPDDLKVPESLFQQSIQQNATFLGSHLELGRTYLLAGEVDKAVKKFEDVLTADQRFASALSNLGYSHLVLANFEEDPLTKNAVLRKARDYLERARRSQALPEIDLHLGDVYTLLGQYRPAKISHENALETLEKGSENDQFFPFEVLFVFLPERSNEARDRGPALSVSTIGEMKTLVLYSLSLAHAGLQDFENAEKYFRNAGAFDPRRKFSPLIANRMYSLQRSPSIPAKMRTWIANHIELLCKGLEGCKPDEMSH